MRRFYEGNDNKGYQEVVDKEAGLELIGFDLIRLEPGENAVYESGEYEIGLVILQGTCSVKVDDVTFDKLGSRRSVFDGKPTTVYVPRDSKYANSEGRFLHCYLWFTWRQRCCYHYNQEWCERAD